VGNVLTVISRKILRNGINGSSKIDKLCRQITLLTRQDITDPVTGLDNIMMLGHTKNCVLHDTFDQT